MAARIRVGTCSWADESLSKWWYPKGIRTAEERLRHYAEHFDTVELDSSYYRLPEPEQVAKWTERTPEGFLFHVKAFGVMTRHPVRLEQLPPDLREGAQTDDRGRVERPSREFRAEVFGRFHEALEPFRAAGKLGGILLQFPSYVVAKDSSRDYIAWAVEQLRGDLPLVEFRHRSWLDDEHRDHTLSFLESLGASHVVVDAPKTDAKNLVPDGARGDRARSPTSASTAATRTPGTSAAAARPSGSTTSTRTRSCGNGRPCSRSSPTRHARPTPCSTTTAARPRQVGAEREWFAQAPVNALSLKELLG